MPLQTSRLPWSGTLQQFGAPLCLLSCFLRQVGSSEAECSHYTHRETVIDSLKETPRSPLAYGPVSEGKAPSISNPPLGARYISPAMYLYPYNADSDSSFLEH